MATETVWRDGEVWTRDWRGLWPIAESYAELFVHPRTGILLFNRARLAARQRKRSEEAARALQPHPDRRVGLRGMAADCQWHRIDGIWYAVTLATLEANGKAAAAYDVVLRRVVDGRHCETLRTRYGRGALYATGKRQLGSTTLRAHGLASQAVA